MAEGVEDDATMKLLIDYGCDIAQGYHFSPALPDDELGTWLKTSRFGRTVQAEHPPGIGARAA